MFVSCKPSRAVSRFGTGTMIGAELGPAGYVFDTRVIVALSADEVARYGSEYRRAIRKGDLVERSEADFDAFVKAQNDAEREALTKMEAATEAAEAKAKAAPSAEVGAIENG